MSMSSQTEVEVMALDPAESTRARGGRRTKLDRPIKKLRGGSARLGSGSSITGPTGSWGIIQSTTLRKGNKSSAGTRVNSTVQRSAHHYRDAEIIPAAKETGSYVYVYPHADECISVEHMNRFPVIVDIFRHNLQEQSELSLMHPAKTEYKLKMCGTSMNDAKPSILIFHPQIDAKMSMSILSILRRPEVRQQYNSSDMIVCFNIWPFSGPSFKYLGRPMEGLSIQMQDSYIPGALISDDACDRISTITCGIRFPNMADTIFALTTAHAFEKDDDSNGSDTEYEKIAAGMTFELNEDEDVNGDIYKFGDVEYDIAELMKYENIDKQNQLSQIGKQHTDLPRQEQDQFDGLVQTSEAKIVISPNRVWGRPQGSEWANYPNLDWALIEIENSEEWKADDIDLAMYDIPGLGYKSRSVRIITSRGSLHGTICNIPAFIANSSNSSSLCKVWIVSPADSSQISVGDSGALVIDSLTEQPYGYVIAVNHFQELYVVPLKSVLEQISQMMPIPNVYPQIFMTLSPCLASIPLPRDVKDSKPTKLFSQYWPAMDGDNTKSPLDQQLAGIHEPYRELAGDLEDQEQDARPLSLHRTPAETRPVTRVYETSTSCEISQDTTQSTSSEHYDSAGFGHDSFATTSTSFYVDSPTNSMHASPTSDVQEENNVLHQVSICLSKCAYEFFTAHQLPTPPLQNIRPVDKLEDREWDEWVSLLKGLMAKKGIPRRALSISKAAQFETTLENSLRIHQGAKQLGGSLKTDRNTLQLILAGIQVAKMLKDDSARCEIEELYITTETVIRNYREATS